MAGTTLQGGDLVYSVWRPAPPVGKIVGHRGEPASGRSPAQS
jgi:hypothetical protein